MRTWAKLKTPGRGATRRAKVGNEHYNNQYDTWAGPVVDALEHAHGAPIAALARRRHLARNKAA